LNSSTQQGAAFKRTGKSEKLLDCATHLQPVFCVVLAERIKINFERINIDLENSGVECNPIILVKKTMKG
jgi:hypothetical protein